MILFKTIFFILILYSGIAQANKDVNKAIQAYQEKQYGVAANILLKNINHLDQLSVRDKFKASFILSTNLKIYQDIFAKAKINQQTHLNTLLNENNKKQSRYATFYLAENFILNNELTKANRLLERFKTSFPEKNNYTHMADIHLAHIAYRENNKEKYDSIIDGIDRSNPLLDIATHALELLTTGESTLKPATIKQYEQHFIEDNKLTSSRFANDAIQLYLHQNSLHEAAKLLTRLDQRTPAYIEKIGSTKSLRFYNIKLVDTIAKFYYELSKNLLTSIKASNKKYHDLAVFYLSELDLIRPHPLTAKKHLKAVNKLQRLPKNVSALTEIRSTTHRYLLGQHNRAYQLWQNAVDNVKNNPIQSADVVLMCIYLNANCPKIVQSAKVSAENGQSQRFEALNTNVGRYYLLKRNNTIALRLLENALDRSDTEILAANDPILLLNYAEALRLNKNFSESLQILFTLAENFPILRQIQDSVQSEYSFSQQSHGFSNVF